MTLTKTLGVQAMDMDLGMKVSKAKTRLLLQYPFFGALALSMGTVITDNLRGHPIRTAATDGENIYYNPAFVEALTLDETVFLVAHECMHPALGHLWRRGGREMERWNIAADIVINQLLTEEGIGSMIAGGVLSETLYKKGEGYVEGIYPLIPSSQSCGGIGQDIQEPGNAQSEGAPKEDDWKVRVAQAAQAARQAGKLSAGLARLVDDTLQPQVNWREILRAFMVRAKDDVRSFARPARRFLSQGLYLPSMTGEKLGSIVVAVDCSGSIGPNELSEFAAEIRAIHQDGRPVELHVLYFDTEVLHHDTFTTDDDVQINAHGGGGTAFSPVFQYLNTKDIEPVATVFLTDLCCNDFGPAPDHPVLWVTTDRLSAPWGEVVKMKKGM